MGMDISIIGVVPADKKYKNKVKAYYACEDAGIEIPKELEEYFGYQRPNKDGMEISIQSTEHYDDALEEHIINLEDVPDNVKQIIVRLGW